MNFLLINASPHEDGTTQLALNEIKKTVEELGECATVYQLGKDARYSCTACCACKSIGRCKFGDLDDLTELIRKSDGIVFGTPTYYAGAVSTLSAVLSRLCFSKGEILRNKPAATVATARRGGAVLALSEINKYFSFCSMITVGGVYPPILYVDGRDDEGLQNMRSIARCMVWIAKCIKKGEENGIIPPPEETKIKTNI